MIEHNYYVEENEDAKNSKLADCIKCPAYNTCEIKNIVSPIDDSPKGYYSNGIKIFKLDKNEDTSQIKTVEVFKIDKNDDASHFSRVITEENAIKNDSEFKLPFISDDDGTEHCMMSNYNVTVVECGSKPVADGIGDHYKIAVKKSYDHGTEENCYDIELDSKNRWSPQQPVFISAQTGQGKNYFIENCIIPYINDYNYKNQTNYSVLIISNRLALKAQIKNHIEGTDSDDSESEDIIHYSKDASVMTYQSVLKCAKRLTRWQQSLRAKNLFVICDEAHFFTSDAMFNPDTEKILATIVKIFSNAIRVYMSATPYECLKYILDAEEKYYKFPLKPIKEFKKGKYYNKKYDKEEYHCHPYEDYIYEPHQMVFYHFQRNYNYIDLYAFSEFSKLYPIISRSLKSHEKWLIFIDDKKLAASMKKEIESFLNSEEDNKKDKSKSVPESVVMVVSAESKDDKQYADMVKSEKLVPGIKILISTSVLDNGINLNGINNIVVSDMSMVKCLQMVGRARIDRNNSSDRKTVYVKRFTEAGVNKRIRDSNYCFDLYHRFDCGANMSYLFMEGENRERETIKHLFRYTPSGETYINHIARQLIERKKYNYQALLEIFSKEARSGIRFNEGQRYLEYEFSWFGKQYSDDHDVDKIDAEKAKKELIAFLKGYCDKNISINKELQENFSEDFTKYYDQAFDRADRNSQRIYKTNKMNKLLSEQEIMYEIKSDGEPVCWRVCAKDDPPEAKST